MELQTIENMMIVDYQEALIKWDNSELIKLVKNTINKYEGLIVTENVVKDITKEVATLNNLIKKIEDKRKSIKKDYTTPLSIFENNVKEVTAIINTTVNNLKSQLEIFEQKRKEEKLVVIKRIINNIGANEFIQLGVDGTLKIIIHDNFFNKTIKDKEIEDNVRQQYILLSQAYELEQLKIKQEKERIEQEALAREEKVKKRYELLNKMNSQTGLNLIYEDTKYLSDADLMIKYTQILKNTKAEPEKEKIYVAPVEPNFKLCKKDTYSLLIENLTESQMNLIINGLKQKMPKAIFREV